MPLSIKEQHIFSYPSCGFHCRMLTWEDAYYDNDGFPEKKSPGSTAGNLHDGNYSNNRLGVAVAKMSYHVYSLGEGIVGHVAITGKHLWLSADKSATITSLAPENYDGWQAQFSAGIKTIVVAAVAPHGVVQLGSLDSVRGSTVSFLKMYIWLST